jgi:hypothetical protein
VIFIFHVNPQSVDDRIDLSTYDVPPNKPFRFDNDFHAEKFLEHKAPYYGVVKVDQQLDEDTGQFKLDLDKAKKQAYQALEKAEILMVETYVSTQRSDRIRINYPAMPPEGRVADIIERRKIDLGEQYGIYPVGYGKSQATVQREREIETLRKENSDMRDQMTKLMEKMVEAGLIESDGVELKGKSQSRKVG